VQEASVRDGKWILIKRKGTRRDNFDIFDVCHYFIQMSTVEYGFPMIGGLMPVSEISESIANTEFSCERDEAVALGLILLNSFFRERLLLLI